MAQDLIRCFIALELSPHAKQELGLIIQELRTELKYGFRWVPVAHIHLTLKFLGEVQKQLLPQLIERIKNEAAHHLEFEISIGRLGVFPNSKAPRIFWAGIQAPPGLFELQEQIDRQTEELGIPAESRSFSPHLTLARSANSITPENIKPLVKLLAEKSSTFSIPVPISKVTFFQSILRPDGPIYSPLAFAGSTQKLLDSEG